MHLFETQRLIGRPLSRQDLPALTEILSDPEVMKYSVRGVFDENATRNFIDFDCVATTVASSQTASGLKSVDSVICRPAIVLGCLVQDYAKVMRIVDQL